MGNVLSFLRPWAAAIARPGFRAFLMIATAAMTIVLLPVAGFGALVTIVNSSRISVGLAAIAFGGIAGIVAAWTRLLLRGGRFRASVALRVATAIGLAIGIAVGVTLVVAFHSGLPGSAWPFALALGSVVMGFFLLFATLGEAAPDRH